MIKFIIFIPLLFFATNCNGSDKNTREAIIDNYQLLIGEKLDSVEEQFGNSNVVSGKLPLHDPGAYENVFKVKTGGKEFAIRIEDQIVKNVIFMSDAFKTGKGIIIGANFCDVNALYSKAMFEFKFLDSLNLMLDDQESNMRFSFSTGELPLGEFVTNGLPDREDNILCSAILTRITLSKGQ